MSQLNRAKSSNKEGRISFAKQAIKQGQGQSLRAAAESYDVPLMTFYDRIHGKPARSDCTPNSRKLTPYEEEVIIQYILDLDSCGFPLWPRGVQEMADLLLAERDVSPVGKNWATNFINRRPEIQSNSITNTTIRGLNAKIQ
jgi:hypothetical protein